LLNHPFVRDQSRHFASRLLAEPKAPDADRIGMGNRLALGREPFADETKEVTDFLVAYQKQATAKGRRPDEARLTAWQSFCQTLFCRNEFLYVD
jgi:hypothetical protein